MSSVRIPLKQLGWFGALAFLTVVAGIRLWLLSADVFPWEALSGIAVGIATFLKVSPLVIPFYAIARRRSVIAFTGLTTVGAFVAASTWFGGASDLRLFAVQVLPALSGASSSFQNVSLPAFAFRLFSHVNDFTRVEAGLGGWQYAAAPFTLVAIAVLWSVSNQREGVYRHDYAALILVALLAGPLTWTHYVSWALVAVVLLADESPWRRRDRSIAWISVALLAFGILAEVIPTQSFRPITVAQHWWLRIATGINSFGLFALLAVAIRGKLTESQASRGQGLVEFVELPSLPKGVAQ